MTFILNDLAASQLNYVMFTKQYQLTIFKISKYTIYFDIYNIKLYKNVICKNLNLKFTAILRQLGIIKFITHGKDKIIFRSIMDRDQ